MKKLYPLLSFDILPMNSPDMEKSKYAVSLLKEDLSSMDWSKVTKNKMISIINKHHPVYIGTDNPNEIIGSDETLGDFCDRIPVESSLVHVNLALSGNSIPLQSVLRMNNFPVNKKLSPLETARALNQLIVKGIGMRLEPYEEETIIRVGRPKKHKKGGWSQSRFQRYGEEIVNKAYNEIKETLVNFKIKYDEEVTKTKYGAKWAQFYIFDRKEKIDKLFNNKSFFPAKVNFWRPKKEIISHTPLVESENNDFYFNQGAKRLIIGVDPGMETGISIVDLEGNVLHLFSKKSLTRGEITNIIIQFGIPALVCADVHPIPIMVKKIASLFNAKISSPIHELKQVDKKSLIKNYVQDQKVNSHKRDALSAAIYAYRKYEENFHRVDKDHELTRKQKQIAKILLIRDFSLKKSMIKAQQTEHYEEIQPIKIQETKNKTSQEINFRLREKSLEESISFYKAELERKEIQLKQMKQSNKKLRKKFEIKENIIIEKQLRTELISTKDLQIKKLNDIINNNTTQIIETNNRIEELENMIWLSMRKGGYPIKVLHNFSIDDIIELKREKGIYDDDILLILDPTGGGPNTGKMIKDIRLKLIFIEKNKFTPIVENIFFEEEIYYINSDKYDIRRLHNTALISKNNLDLALKDAKKQFIERKNKIKSESIDNTIKNYHYEREKELEELKIKYDDFIPNNEEL